MKTPNRVEPVFPPNTSLKKRNKSVLNVEIDDCQNSRNAATVLEAGL